MEEQRIGMMYLNLLKGRLTRGWGALFPRGLRRSSAFFGLLVTAILLVPAIGWYLHMHGRFHDVKRDLNGDQQSMQPAVPRPGGSDPVVLTRSQTAGSNLPEFLSATLLPGVGMDVLQITASIPNRGEVPLLVAPTVAAMANGPLDPRSGSNDSHGELELPWAGAISGLISPAGTSLTTNWKGQTISVPRDPQERPGVSEGGLLMTQGADRSGVTPDGTALTATGVFRGTDFDGHWLSKTDVSVSAQLEARTIDLVVTAKNVGEQAEPMGIGWHPRFALTGKNRDAVEIRLPNGEMLEIGDRAGDRTGDKTRGTLSGRMLPASETISRFQGHAAALGGAGIDVTLVKLKPALLDSAVSAELRDTANGIGLRITAVSSNTRALQLTSPAGANYISLGLQTNYDDPLGKEWSNVEGDGIATLDPGDTMVWKLRLEIFSISKR